jgi:sporulation protein YlmC with PRC-barrel domain
MSTRIIGGRFFTDAEIRLLLGMAVSVRASHVRNGGGSSPLLSLCDEIFNDVNGITTMHVYTADGKLVGTVSSADIDLLDESAADRLVDGRQNPPIDALSVEPGEAYLCTKEIAERLGIPGETGMRIVRKELLERRLHGEQLGGTNSSWRVAESEVERWVAEQQQPQ